MKVGRRWRKLDPRKAIIAVLKLLTLLLLIVGIPTYLYFAYPEWIQHFSSQERINTFLAKYETYSILVYIGLQILQVTIAFIPGQALQFAGGYAFGTMLCFLLSLIGIAIGSILSFSLARVLGRDAMHLLFGEQKISHYIHLLNSRKAVPVLLVLYLIPGVPKDLIAFAAGVSEFRLQSFLLLSLTGRAPALLGMTAIGQMFRSGDYTGILILSVVSVLLFLASLFYRKKIFHWIDLYYDRFQKDRG